MFQELFKESSLLDLPVVVLVAFFATFVGVVLWVTARKRGDRYDQLSRMPLDDSFPDSESQPTPRTGGHTR